MKAVLSIITLMAAVSAYRFFQKNKIKNTHVKLQNETHEDIKSSVSYQQPEESSLEDDIYKYLYEYMQIL